jgi:MtN3 and saliva related transmembrane protein
MRELISNIMFIIAGILWGIEVIPQIRKTLKTKSVKDISLPFFIICLVAYGVYFVGAILIRNWYLAFSHIPSFIFIGTMVILIFKYKK